MDDWRKYAQKLQSQGEGERAHMIADRKRMEEVMAEERGLWDKERAILKARIKELELELDHRALSSRVASLPVTQTQKYSLQQQAMSFTSPGSNAVSVSSSEVRSQDIPQESGRNADGSPFYAPAARNPSRTFDISETTELRVDSITAPRESAIRVTSKELKSSDFGPQSPLASHELESIPEFPGLPETIDIQLIQPELEGVPIKASAVSPTFAAKVLSPAYSPAILSPSVHPPGRDVGGLAPLVTSSSLRDNGKEKADLEVVMHEPVDRRLTMHAGHTPNHSISKFDFGESGAATPTQDNATTQENTDSNKNNAYKHVQHSSLSNLDGIHEASDDHGDKELLGPLGLVNDSSKDDVFIAQLVEKLKEAQRSGDTSPTVSETTTLDDDEPEKQNKSADGMPVLRLKASFNFGRPLGTI